MALIGVVIDLAHTRVQKAGDFINDLFV